MSPTGSSFGAAGGWKNPRSRMTYPADEQVPGVRRSSSVLDWALTRTRGTNRVNRRSRSASDLVGAASEGYITGTAEEKLLIVDWDDTVLPTSYLNNEDLLRSSDPLPYLIQRALRKYTKRVKATLELLAAHGRVVIVTNAEEGWVERSCARFLPDLEPLVRGLPRISARPFAFGENDEVRPTEWKVEAFVTLARLHFAHPAGQTVFSLGDSTYERDAVRRTSERLGVKAQSVKLMNYPSLETLEAEHAFLQNDLLRNLLRQEDPFDFHLEEDADSPKEGSPVDFGGKARFESAEIPVCFQEFASWSDLIEAALPESEDSEESELNKSRKSTSSTSSTVSTAASENVASPEELSSDWILMV